MKVQQTPAPSSPHFRDLGLSTFQSWHRLRRPDLTIGLVLFVGGYFALLFWFQGVDVYHRHFSTSGLLPVLYNLFRILFLPYLAWIIYSVGIAGLRLVTGTRIGQIACLDRLLLGFFAGCGLWHLIMLLLGYLSLYTVPLAIGITMPIIVLSYPHLRFVASESRSTCLQLGQQQSKGLLVTASGLTLVTLGVAIALLLTKGLYPSGGHDYFTHYGYFYQTVIQKHGILPNQVWYHYYYSKGAGLFYLGMLLTDALAPQLVTYCLVLASALALFWLIWQIAPNTLWAWVAVILYLAFYIYTPGSQENMAHGGWGDFEKLHELTTAFTIAILWFTVTIYRQLERLTFYEASSLEYSNWLSFVQLWLGTPATPWLLGCALTLIATSLITLPMSAFWAAYFMAVALWFILNRRYFIGFTYLLFTLVSGGCLVGLLLINDITTGLLNDQGILLFWQVANLERLAQWGVLPLVVLLHWYRTAIVDNGLDQKLATNLAFLHNVLRLDLIAPVVIASAGSGLIYVLRYILLTRLLTRKRPLDSSQPTVSRLIMTHYAGLWLVLGLFIVFALVTGRSQTISFYRFSSFAFPIMIAVSTGWLAILTGQVLNQTSHRRWLWIGGQGIPLILLVISLMYGYRTYNPNYVTAIATNSGAFITGQYSIDDAYVHQEGLPGRLPWGGIYPGSRSAFETVGAKSRIWSLHNHSYCMIPDCRIESYMSFIMSPHWEEIIFGDPETARRRLQGEGLNFFLISQELAIADPLPLSLLFSPDHIDRYLGIAWTDGTTALLTWKNARTMPLGTDWLMHYRQQISESAQIRGFPYEPLKASMATISTMPRPLRPFRLPWEELY